MNIRKLNEELYKLLREPLYELSDDTVKSAVKKREDEFDSKRRDFISGKISKDAFKNAGDKLKHINDLVAKRTSRHDNNKKHLVIPWSTINKIENGNSLFLDCDYAFITDDDLLKLVNLEENIFNDPNGKTIISLEDAKQYLSDSEFHRFQVYGGTLFDSGKISYDSSDTISCKILFDTKPEDAEAEINGIGEKARKQIEKYKKFVPKQLIKLLEKGQIENVDFKSELDQHGNRPFSYDIVFKNPGFPDAETLKKYSDGWKAEIHSQRWSIPRPKARTNDGYARLYSNCVEHGGYLEFIDKKTLKVEHISGYEELPDEE